jgi:hypothetical protein
MIYMINKRLVKRIHFCVLAVLENWSHINKFKTLQWNSVNTTNHGTDVGWSCWGGCISEVENLGVNFMITTYSRQKTTVRSIARWHA